MYNMNNALEFLGISVSAIIIVLIVISIFFPIIMIVITSCMNSKLKRLELLLTEQNEKINKTNAELDEIRLNTKKEE